MKFKRDEEIRTRPSPWQGDALRQPRGSRREWKQSNAESALGRCPLTREA